MANLFTPEHLIRFLYHETSQQEDALLKQQLALDPALLAQFQQLLETSMMLDELQLEPTETSVNLILEFSREQIEEASHA